MCIHFILCEWSSNKKRENMHRCINLWTPRSYSSAPYQLIQFVSHCPLCHAPPPWGLDGGLMGEMIHVHLYLEIRYFNKCVQSLASVPHWDFLWNWNNNNNTTTTTKNNNISSNSNGSSSSSGSCSYSKKQNPCQLQLQEQQQLQEQHLQQQQQQDWDNYTTPQ